MNCTHCPQLPGSPLPLPLPRLEDLAKRFWRVIENIWSDAVRALSQLG